jgi:hypothetical protein
MTGWDATVASVLTGPWQAYLSENAVYEDFVRSVSEADALSPLHAFELAALQQMRARGFSVPEKLLDPGAPALRAIYIANCLTPRQGRSSGQL